MPDTDYHPDEESEELARKLASSTVEDLREPSSERSVSLDRHAEELGIDAPMSDVTFVVQEFAWQWELAAMIDGNMLCVRIGEETVPLSLPFDWPFPKLFRYRMNRFWFPREYVFEAYQEAIRSRREIEEVSVQSPENVLERFKNGLSSFLAYRIAGFRAWVGWMTGREQSGRGNLGPPPPPSLSPGGGLGVEFLCNARGLTIEFSHSYFIHFLNFGAPSFPVNNTLLAGRYVFQGRGPTYLSGTPRSQVFRIPPDYKAETTLF